MDGWCSLYVWECLGLQGYAKDLKCDNKVLLCDRLNAWSELDLRWNISRRHPMEWMNFGITLFNSTLKTLEVVKWACPMNLDWSIVGVRDVRIKLFWQSRQQSRVWPYCIGVEAGLVLYLWQTLSIINPAHSWNLSFCCSRRLLKFCVSKILLSSFMFWKVWQCIV